jgi:uncharacterized protein with FMN-binding domain
LPWPHEPEIQTTEKEQHMNRSLPLAVAALGAATAAGAVPAAAAAAAKATKYKGSTVSYKYGTLSVTITKAKSKIGTVSVSYTPESPRSSQLDSLAVPELWKEALKLQGWNVHTISGVSYTSAAFRQSLYSAMGHADLLKK